ncbi:hypothetical protein CAI53_09410 [Salmonella enterica subsp. enterica serovar Paratyphi B str. CFSAN000540]|uniref:Uncharacterized protein n=1 Tax=Salmonella enterica subsp. enterica serovar Paratyphi B str. CFSAN000540 TaxID=1299076 RepID=A0A8E6KWB4_SALEB|nr:hypothetical protein CAI53_09410 [Salmonella enterica subsp. enterica serovar Paratyphi B str. CFSAN000540]
MSSGVTLSVTESDLYQALGDYLRGLFCDAAMENPQLGWGFRKAFSFKPVIKTPFDLLKHLAVWQLQKFNKKSKGGPNGGRKELSAHPMEL